MANSSKAINREKKVNPDEVDNVTPSERQILAAGDSGDVSGEDVHLTENRR